MAQYHNQLERWLRLLGPSKRAVSPGGASVTLPKLHAALLTELGAAVSKDGFTRLFGLGESEGLSSLSDWNAVETWRFAWPAGIDQYTLFGETAWGDQYAYARSDLGESNPPIYRLSGDNMSSSQIASDLDEFLNVIFSMFETVPDEYAIAAREQFGRIDVDAHIATIPPAMISDVPNPEFTLMPAAAHLVLNGDIYTQCMAAKGRKVSGMEIVRDEKGRERARVSFSKRWW